MPAAAARAAGGPSAALRAPAAPNPPYLRAAELTGRPLGSDDFVTRLEDLVQRRLRRQRPGRKAKASEMLRASSIMVIVWLSVPIKRGNAPLCHTLYNGYGCNERKNHNETLYDLGYRRTS